MGQLKQKIKANYHWVILAILLIHSTAFGCVANAATVYVIPITESLQISRGLFSTLGTLSNIVMTIGTLFTTRFLHKYGYRKTAAVSLGSLALTCVVTALSKNVYIYAFSRILYGLCHGAMNVTGVSWIMRSWFHKHYGTCLGIVTMGTGVGGMISSVISAAMIEAWGWQWSYVATAAFIGLTMLLYFLVRNTPEQIGLKPYGEGQLFHDDHKKTKRLQQWKGIAVNETRKHPAFKLMCVFMFLLNFCLWCPWFIVAPHFQDNGYTAMEAASYQSVMMLALAVGKLLCGWVSEKIGGKALGVVCVVCTIVGHLGFADVSNPYVSYLWMILLAISMTLTSVSVPLITEAIFGVETGTSLVGTLMGMSSAAAIVAPPICNIIYDAIGTYSPVFFACGVFDIVWLGMLFVVFRKFGKVEKQWLLEHRS